MRHSNLLCLVLFASLSTPALAANPEVTTGKRIVPATRRMSLVEKVHGVSVADPYRWLENGKDKEVLQWMGAQDAATRARLDALPGRAEIAARLKEVFYVDKVFPPSHRGDRYFWHAQRATEEKMVMWWRQGKDGEAHVLLDPNTWSDELALGEAHVSIEGKLVAYTVHKNNSDAATLHVMDVETGKVSDVDVIDDARYATASWVPGGAGFYYTWLPTDPKIPVDKLPGFMEVRFHRMGQNPARDAVIRKRTNDSNLSLEASVTRDGHWLVLEIARGWTATDIWFRDLRIKDNTAWTPLRVKQESMYSVVEYADRFYVETNEGAPNGRVFVVDPARPERAAWKEIVAEQKDAALESMTITGGLLALNRLKDVLTHVEIRALDGTPIREVTLPGPGTATEMVGHKDEDEAFFGFSSYTVPFEIYAYSMSTGETKLWNRPKIPVDTALFSVEQVFFTSKDGARVPMFIVSKKGTPRDGSAPLLLTGYGGFSVAMKPEFDGSILPWLERGGVYAVPGLRGGAEYGEGWHEAGMREQKQHVFDDFIAAAEFLVGNKWTSPDRLVIEGGSNGGLLVGAVMVQRPDLFRVVLCDVPLLDMVRYHRFGAGRTWMDEYGSAEDAKQFKALYAYSPYHHVTTGVAYPALLLGSADSDDRVDPMHARKFAAALQSASSGGEVLLAIERNAGHGGNGLLKGAIAHLVDQYSFAWANLPAH